MHSVEEREIKIIIKMPSVSILNVVLVNEMHLYPMDPAADHNFKIRINLLKALHVKH
jgi:hypothetical protein